MRRNTTFQSKRAQIRIARILNLLEGQMLSSQALAENLHCHQSGVTDYIKHLKSTTPRQVRIADYEVVNGCKRALYALGSEPDAPMTTQTNQEKWAKVKAKPEVYAKSLESRRKSAARIRATKPKLRDRRNYDPPLPVQVNELVVKKAGYTIPEIAVMLDASERAVIRAVNQLREQGLVRRAKNGMSKKFRWESPANPLPKFVEQPIQKQGIFSALGL